MTTPPPGQPMPPQPIQYPQAPPLHGHHYPPPPQHYAYPPAYPVPPQPAKRTPWHHYVTWPAVGLTALTEVYTGIARIADYQSVIVLAFLATAASITALAVSVRARHAVTIVFAVLSLLAALYLLGTGYDAMEQYQHILDETLRELDDF
ncbi:hypothetical protein [Saccharomonospora cyanea]|uniref:Uncharacterized protein n=1 Tax=Saccharomonospora cyanea NA-134 TaxID=882082 RepID=H5XHA6_9PSEU|nr:hypothetical protein [Saccharomonospora cyanea]EHR60591.1 hypothetical protein SaccyDRAFT_1693 [Saccharomonospora cyanea NA-134]